MGQLFDLQNACLRLDKRSPWIYGSNSNYETYVLKKYNLPQRTQSFSYVLSANSAFSAVKNCYFDPNHVKVRIAGFIKIL